MVIGQWAGRVGRREMLIATVWASAFWACNRDDAHSTGEATSRSTKCAEVSAAVKTATVRLANGSSFTFELNRAAAPKSVENFIDKARCEAFTGTIFHRVEDWVIQGGDPVTVGKRGEDYLLASDPEQKRLWWTLWLKKSGKLPYAGRGGGKMPTEKSDQPFTAGAVGFARGADPALTNDSQFFVLTKDARHLDGAYTYIGKVTKGLNTVRAVRIGDKIAGIEFN